MGADIIVICDSNERGRGSEEKVNIMIIFDNADT